MRFVSLLLVLSPVLLSGVASADGADTKPKARLGKDALSHGAVTINSPQANLDGNRAAKTSGKSSKLNTLREINQGPAEQGKLPQRRASDVASDTKLGGHGSIGRADSADVDELVREVMGLGGDGLSSAHIDRGDSGGLSAAKYGSGTAAAAAGAPANPGHSSSQGTFGRLDYGSSNNSNSTSYTARFVHVNGNVSQVGESWSNNKFGGDTYVATHTVTDGAGNVIYQAEHTEVTDKNGEVVSRNDRESGTPLSPEDQEDLNKATDEIVAQLFAELDDAGQEAPTDNATGKGGPCNMVTGFGCETRKTSHMDKISQPVHGDDVRTLEGSGGRPNAGPSSVTNPGTHDGSSAGRGGRRGGKPGSDAIDPEEIVPGTGGVGPAS